ncbi:unnamed protein product, partial [Ectocarpus fasciculatus]
ALCPELEAKLKEYRQSRNFNPQTWSDSRCHQLLVYLKNCNLNSVVISISGGVDSSSVLALLVKAQDLAPPDHPFYPSNGGKIVAITQPIHSTPSIQNRAYEVAEAFGFVRSTPDTAASSRLLVVIEQTSEFDSLTATIEGQTGAVNGFSKSMFKSYMRTPTAYLLASHFRGVVVGTGNLDEDGYLYYYCKFGDGAVDVGLIWDIHKSEVFTVAGFLGVPKSILDAPPSADLAPDQTDEAEIGATYDMIEIITGWWNNTPEGERAVWVNTLSEEARNQFNTEFERVDAIHRRGSHKADLNPKNM